MLIKLYSSEALVNFVFMKIAQHISQLLYRYQCVMVPGFGAFLTETQSAQMQQGTHTFFPPKKLLSFNAQIKSNDGLLANYIARHEKISYEEAVVMIQHEVAIWQSMLDTNQAVTLNNIGFLSLNDDHNIVFSPNAQKNYLAESFGLSAVNVEAIERIAVENLLATSEQPNTVFDRKAEIVQNEIVQDEVAETPVIAMDTQKRRPYLHYAAVLVLALAVTGSVGYNFFQTQVAADTLQVQNEVQQEVRAKIQEATFFIENPIPSVTLNVRDTKMPYHVVAGAFRNVENADKIFQKLSDAGYKSKKLEVNNFGLTPVIYGSFSSYTEAYKLMKTIQKTDNPDAWLLIKEL